MTAGVSSTSGMTADDAYGHCRVLRGLLLLLPLLLLLLHLLIFLLLLLLLLLLHCHLFLLLLLSGALDFRLSAIHRYFPFAVDCRLCFTLAQEELPCDALKERNARRARISPSCREAVARAVLGHSSCFGEPPT